MAGLDRQEAKVPMQPSASENMCARERCGPIMRRRARALHEEAIQLEKFADWAEYLNSEQEGFLWQIIHNGIFGR